MSGDTDTNDSADSHDYHPDYDGLETAVQRAQDALVEVHDIIDGHNDAFGAIRNSLEETEDIIDEAQDTDNPDLLSEADAYVDDTQKTINHLEDAVDYDVDPERTAEALDDLDDAVEAVEDALEAERDAELVVVVSNKQFVPDEFVMTPSAILEAAGFDRADYLLYYGADAEEEDPHIPKGTDVDLREHHIFSAIPDETGYGAASDEPSDDLADLPAGLATEVRDLRDDYEVDVDADAEANFTHIIVRDYPVPADAYNKEETDILIRVPAGYPEQAPDWVYVEGDFRLANDNLPRKAQTLDTNPNNDALIEGWVGLSWHLNNLNSVQWKPYEHDLRWYLETICRGRLEQGD